MFLSRALCAAGFFFLAVMPLSAAVTVSVDSQSLTVTGATPGGEVLVFGRSHRYLGGIPRLRRHVFQQTDADRDGTVVVPLTGVPLYSVWVAVDYETGSYATVARGFTPRVITLLPTREWREGSIEVDLGRSYLDFLLVRAKKGAWALDVYQGGAQDADGRIDATLRLRIADMQPLLGKEAPPPHAARKDILVVVDPRQLDLLIVAAE